MTRKLLIASSLVALGLINGATPASAADDSRPERYEVATPLSDIKAGAAQVHVHASLERVQQVVTNFASYSEYISRFEKAKVIGRHGDSTDVYLQVPIMKGTAKVWAVVRFEPPKKVSDDLVVVGRMLKGNVKRLDAKWKMSRVDDSTTKLGLELLIVPDWVIPVPGSMVTGEAASAASRAVSGLRVASERTPGQ